MRRQKLSSSVKREMERAAAEEFFRRLRTPPTQVRSLEPAQEQPEPAIAQQTDLPPSGTMLGVQDSKEILRRLASGELKQVRRR